MKKTIFAITLCSISILCAEKTNSITQFGITWTFDREYECGKFANEDFWVVGPVSIISIDPPSVTVGTVVAGQAAQHYDPGKVGAKFDWIKNGSMLNPSPGCTKQGYDNTVGRSPSFAKELYDPGLNVAVGVSREKPLILQPYSSLISTISRATPYNRPQPDIGAVLTVLKEPAPEGSFRPPYSGNDKTIKYNKNQLKRDLLLKLKPETAVPKIEDVEKWFEKPWLDHVPGWLGVLAHPIRNLPDYPAEMCNRVSIASLMLLLDFSKEKKEKLLVSFVQVGIDQYEIYAGTKDKPASFRWCIGGGFGSGRKWPIVFAGIMLDDKNMQQVDMLKMCNEDSQTYYGNCWTGSKVCWGMSHSIYIAKESIKAGNEDHEEKHPSLWTYDGRGKPGDPVFGECSNIRSENYKRCCNSFYWVGEALAVRLMGMTKIWNHDAFFDYVDRWMTEDDTETNKVIGEYKGKATFNSQFPQRTSKNSFVDAMWKKYRPSIQPPPDGWKTEHKN